MPRYCTMLMLALIATLGAPHALGDSITLRSAVLVDANAPVRLGAVADLQGAEAVALTDVIIVENAAQAAQGKLWLEIVPGDVRKALEEVNANVSRISISGGTCTARLEAPRVVTHTKKTQLDTPPEYEILAGLKGSTIRARVAQSIARLLGVELDAVRLLFDRGDDKFLAQTTWGRHVVIQPTTSGASSNLMVEVRVFSGGDARLIERKRLRVEAEVRQHVVMMQNTLRRGQAVKPGDIELRELWMKVKGSAPVASIDLAVASIARRRIDAGSVLRTSDLEPPIMVKRGQMVTVHCLRSGFAVKSRARAMAQGRLGDNIEFKLDGSERSFTARVDGPGEAVIDMDGRRQFHYEESD